MKNHIFVPDIGLYLRHCNKKTEKTMKQFSMILALLPVALAFPLTAGAINYVNEDAPGVHKEWDKKLKKEVWKTGMGSYLCDVKDSKPLHAIDEDYFAENITQEGKDLMGVHKEWDKKRGCFVAISSVATSQTARRIRAGSKRKNPTGSRQPPFRF